MKPANDVEDDAAPIVTMTRGQLKRLVRAELRHELEHTPPKSEYLSSDDVAILLGCTPKSVATYCTRDNLPCIRIGKIRRFLREDVLAWLELRHSQPRSHKTSIVRSLASVRQQQKT